MGHTGNLGQAVIDVSLKSVEMIFEEQAKEFLAYATAIQPTLNVIRLATELAARNFFDPLSHAYGAFLSTPSHAALRAWLDAEQTQREDGFVRSTLSIDALTFFRERHSRYSQVFADVLGSPEAKGDQKLSRLLQRAERRMMTVFWVPFMARPHNWWLKTNGRDRVLLHAMERLAQRIQQGNAGLEPFRAFAERMRAHSTEYCCVFMATVAEVHLIALEQTLYGPGRIETGYASRARRIWRAFAAWLRYFGERTGKDPVSCWPTVLVGLDASAYRPDAGYKHGNTSDYAPWIHRLAEVAPTLDWESVTACFKEHRDRVRTYREEEAARAAEPDEDYGDSPFDRMIEGITRP
jgi:hypothetical protein